MRTADPVISSRLKAATELYLPLTALGEMRFGLQRAGNSRRAVEQWERFSKEVVLLLPDDAISARKLLLRGGVELSLDVEQGRGVRGSGGHLVLKKLNEVLAIRHR